MGSAAQHHQVRVRRSVHMYNYYHEPKQQQKVHVHNIISAANNTYDSMI